MRYARNYGSRVVHLTALSTMPICGTYLSDPAPSIPWTSEIPEGRRLCRLCARTTTENAR
jgi:hypothetical protein